MSTVLANTITAVGGGGSTVKVNNDATFISDGGAVTNSNLVQGLCKAWVNFDGTASGAASRDTFNVSGMTDNGTGDYTISINNDMSNDDYCTVVSGAETGSSGDTNQIGSIKRNGTYTTSAVTVCGTHTNSQDDVDNQRMMAAIHGDLA